MVNYFENDEENSLKVLFRIFDVDGDDRIDVNDMKTIMSAVCNTKIYQHEAEAMIRETDLTEDGKLDFQEF